MSRQIQLLLTGVSFNLLVIVIITILKAMYMLFREILRIMFHLFSGILQVHFCREQIMQIIFTIIIQVLVLVRLQSLSIRKISSDRLKIMQVRIMNIMTLISQKQLLLSMQSAIRAREVLPLMIP